MAVAGDANTLESLATAQEMIRGEARELLQEWHGGIKLIDPDMQVEEKRIKEIGQQLLPAVKNRCEELKLPRCGELTQSIRFEVAGPDHEDWNNASVVRSTEEREDGIVDRGGVIHMGARYSAERSDNEVANVLGHEAGHHIESHAWINAVMQGKPGEEGLNKTKFGRFLTQGTLFAKNLSDAQKREIMCDRFGQVVAYDTGVWSVRGVYEPAEERSEAHGELREPGGTGSGEGPHLGRSKKWDAPVRVDADDRSGADSGHTGRRGVGEERAAHGEGTELEEVAGTEVGDEEHRPR